MAVNITQTTPYPYQPKSTTSVRQSIHSILLKQPPIFHQYSEIPSFLLFLPMLGFN